MTWQVIWYAKAAKFVEKLPKEIAERVLKKMCDVAEDPFRYLEHFEGEAYKVRIGDYRALIDVDLHGKVLNVTAINKRGRVYK